MKREVLNEKCSLPHTAKAEPRARLEFHVGLSGWTTSLWERGSPRANRCGKRGGGGGTGGF